MDLDAIVVALADIDRLEQEAETARRAPVALADQMSAAHAMLAHAEAVFRASPLNVPAIGGPQAVGNWLIGLAWVIGPALLKPIIESSIKDRLAGFEDEALTAAQRRDRIGGAERRVQQLVAGFTMGDLRACRNKASALHGILRGLSLRCTELQQRSLRVNGARSISSPRPAGFSLSSAKTCSALSRSSTRQAASAAADRGAIEAEAELAADKADLAGLEAECEAAAVLWRRSAATARRLEELMARRPAVAA
jgi:hypothetical protein